MSASESTLRTPATSLTSMFAPLWQGLFGSLSNTLITLFTGAFLAAVLVPFLRWAVIDRLGRALRRLLGWQRCVLGVRHREVSLHHLRFLSTCIAVASAARYRPAPRAHDHNSLAALLAFGTSDRLAADRRRGWLLLAGNLFPPLVPQSQWGGLPITLFVWVVCFALATPLAIVLALARRSNMGGLRSLAVGYIEVMRGTPMVAILYVAMLILPMAVPSGDLIDRISGR